jgi:integrase/recombinase XerC
MPERSEWQEAETAWIAEAQHRSVHTARSYERAMKRFKAFVDKPLADVGGADVRAWVDDLHDSDLSANTVNTYLAAVSSFYRYCIHIHTVVVDGREQGLTTYNPTTRVKRDAVQKYGTVRSLTVDEMRALLAQPDRTTETGARDYAIILMAFLTGRRNSEIRNLRWRDIQGGRRYHWRGKRAKERTDELPAPVWAAIVSYQRASGKLDPVDKDPVFTSVRFPRQTLSSQYLVEMVSSYAEAAGIAQRVTFHMLRHTYASIAYESGANLGDVRYALGHNSLDTTRIYIDQLGAVGNTQWQALWAAVERVENSSEGTAKLPVLGVCSARGGVALENDGRVGTGQA